MYCMEVKQALLFPALGLSGDDTRFPPGHHKKELFRMWPASYFSPSLAERIKRRITVVLVRARNSFSPPSSLSSASNLSEIRSSGITEVTVVRMGPCHRPAALLSALCSSVLCLVCSTVSTDITITPFPLRGNYSKYEWVFMLRIFSLAPLIIVEAIGKHISNLSILDQYFYSIKLVSEEQDTSSFARFLYQIVTLWIFVS